MSEVAAFSGYNLRGLIFAYLEANGWTWNEEGGSWSRGDCYFSGPFATDMAINEQIETEEGRRK